MLTPCVSIQVSWRLIIFQLYIPIMDFWDPVSNTVVWPLAILSRTIPCAWLWIFRRALKVCTDLLLLTDPRVFRTRRPLRVTFCPLLAIFLDFPIPIRNFLNLIRSCDKNTKQGTHTSGHKNDKEGTFQTSENNEGKRIVWQGSKNVLRSRVRRSPLRFQTTLFDLKMQRKILIPVWALGAPYEISVPPGGRFPCTWYGQSQYGCSGLQLQCYTTPNVMPSFIVFRRISNTTPGLTPMRLGSR